MAKATPTQTTIPNAEQAFPDQQPAPADTAGPTEQAGQTGQADPRKDASGKAIGDVLSRTIFTGDNLHVLRGLNSDTVDLIYLDPPFNSNRNYAAPIGSKAASAAFKDTWTLDDVDLAEHDLLEHDHPELHAAILSAQQTAGDSTMSYLIMMAPRLLEMRRVLKPTGSIFLHCDPTASHYLKMVMDAIFGRDNFRNEIAWCYRFGAGGRKQFSRKHDVLFFYSNGRSWTFNWEEVAIPARSAWAEQGGIKMVNERDWWDIPSINNKERTGYPTQKPTALLERIVLASSNEGDVVLDPFAGCATAAIAAEKLGRKWVGIDLSPMAFKLVKERLDNQLNLPGLSPIHRTDQPHRTDLGKLPAPRTHLKELWLEQDGRCNGCGGWFRPEGHDVDHVVPKNKGGTDHISNLQVLCRRCNASKGNRPMSYLTAKNLHQRGITYGGKVTAIVEAEEARQAAEATEQAPDELKTTLAGMGLDPERVKAVLVETLKELDAQNGDNTDGK